MVMGRFFQFFFKRYFATAAVMMLLGSFQVHAIVTYTVDAAGPNDMTIVLKDFNGTGPDHTGLSANAGADNLPVYEGNEKGYASYSTKANASDPRVTFASQPYDVNQYNYVRVRLKASATASSEMWPDTPTGPTTLPLGSVGTAFTEIQKAWVNPTNASIKTATDGGFRWDPIAGANPLVFDLDYFIVDRGRVIGFEFDTISAMSGSYQGWQPNAGFNTHLVTNSALTGTTGGNDPYIQNTSLSVDASIYKYAEIRLKADAGTDLQFFWANSSSTFSEDKSLRPTDADGEWHTYMLDFTDESTWSGTINRFRVDIGNNTPANPATAFEIDYIRFREFGAVPEPSRMFLGALAGMMMLLGRRRKGML